SSQTPSKEDLDNLFGPMYEEYVDKRSFKVSFNSATQTTLNNEDTPSLSLKTMKLLPWYPLLKNKSLQTQMMSLLNPFKKTPHNLTENTWITPFSSPGIDEAELSSTAQDPSNMQ
nr:hypothetical protein [Tanacetum cinerariifolium]